MRYVCNYVLVVRKMPKLKQSRADGDASMKTFEIDCILNSRIGKGNRTEYLLKWIGYPDSESTWECNHDLICPKLIEAYERKHSKGQSSACASAPNSSKLRRSLYSMDINRLKVKVGVVQEWKGLLSIFKI